MTQLDPARYAVIVDRLLASPVAARLGITVDEARGGQVRLTMPFGAANITEGDMVHGGVIATLADIAGVAGAVSAAREVPVAGATARLSVNYLSTAKGCTLTATSHLVQDGARHHVVRVEIHGAPGQLIAEALVTVVLV